MSALKAALGEGTADALNARLKGGRLRYELRLGYPQLALVSETGPSRSERHWVTKAIASGSLRAMAYNATTT